MGAYNCDSLINNKESFSQLKILFQKTINLKENSDIDKSESIQHNLLEEYNYLKTKSNFKKEIFQISKKCKIISGFQPLIKKKEIFINWIKILYNLECISDFKKKKKKKMSNNIIFQMNLEYAFLNNKKTFLKLVSQGLPHNFRQFIWTIIIDKDEKDLLNISNNEREKIHFQTLISINKNCKDIEQIEKDVYRTFINEKDKTEKNLTILRELLIALNNLNEKIGYCQGINFIVGFILKVSKFNKIKAFHLSRLILRKIKGYFSNDFPLLKYNLKKFNQGFKTLFPKLYSHFKENDVIDELWIGKWIQTLFTVNLPFKECCYIWDSLLVYGFDFIVPISLSILNFTEKKLLKFNDSSDIIAFLQETFNPNPDYIVNQLYKEDTDINNYVIPIYEIISYAKKVRNQLNLGPADGNEYTFRNLLDRRKSFYKLASNSSIFNYETKMEKINEKKNEEKNNEKVNSPNNQPSLESTEDLSSLNKINNNNDNNSINYSRKRVNKFLTIYHKENKNEEKIVNNDTQNNNNNNRSLSHHNTINNLFTNNNFFSNKLCVNENKSDIHFNDINNNNTRNITKINNNVNTLYQNLPNNYNKAFTINNNFCVYNNNFNENKINEIYNSYNNNLYEHQTQKSFNLYKELNRMSLYKNNKWDSNGLQNLKNNIYKKNGNTFVPNNNNFIINNKTLDNDSYLNGYNNSYYNLQNEKREVNNTPEVDKRRVKEKIKSKFSNNNLEDDTIFSGINEFNDGERYRNTIPEFNNIQIIKPY